MSQTKLRLGVSACLLGKQVRFDGGHKKNDFLCDSMGRFVEWVPVCPEVGAGMPIPRETLRLVSQAQETRLLGNRSQQDFTDVMRAWSENKVEEIAGLDVDGFVLKKDSPSCGITRVKVYPEKEGLAPSRTGSGVFAAVLQERLPSLPIAEEGWMEDGALRESFLAQVFTYRRAKKALKTPSRQALISFHTEHKLLFMAHNPEKYRELGRLVGSVSERPIEETVALYLKEAIRALRTRATPGKHANVLMHILGYFKDALAPWEKAEVLTLIEEFRGGLYGRTVPLTLLKHHLRLHQKSEWLSRQVYLQPYPNTLLAG